MMKALLAMAAGLVFAVAAPGHAHGENEIYVFMDVYADRISGDFEVRLADLAPLDGLDGDGDGLVSEAEFTEGRAVVDRVLAPLVAFDIWDGPQGIAFGAHRFLDTESGTFAVLAFAVTGERRSIPDMLTLSLTAPPPGQTDIRRGFIVLRNNVVSGLLNNVAGTSVLFTWTDAAVSLELGRASLRDRLLGFAGLGLSHVAGRDHLAFLLVLVLPAALVFAGAGQPAAPRRSALEGLLSILGLVTLFGAMNGVALWLASVAGIPFSISLFELVFVLTIAAIALRNLRAVRAPWIAGVVGAIGLLHGLGYAHILEPFGTYTVQSWVPVAGFSLGFWAGQFVLASILYPVVHLLSAWAGYRRYGLPVVSLLLMAVACWWAALRIVDLAGRLL